MWIHRARELNEAVERLEGKVDELRGLVAGVGVDGSSDPEDLSFRAALVNLATHQLLTQARELGGSAATNLALLGIDFALAIALLTVRATLPDRTATALAGFTRYWWISLPGLLFSALLLAFPLIRATRRSLGPDPVVGAGHLRGIASAAGLDPLTVLTRDLSQAFHHNIAWRRGPALLTRVGLVTLLVTIAYSTYVFGWVH